MKIHRLPLILLTLLVSILLASCSGQAAVNNWPGLSANGDTVYATTRGAVYAVQNGTQVWSYPEKPVATKPFYAAPAFGPDGLVVVGNYGGHEVHAIQSDGKAAWVFTAPSGNFVAPPLVTDSLVLAPSSNNTLYALTLDGKQAWTFTADHMFWAQPVVDAERVFVPGMDHHLYALDLATGKEIWRQDLSSALVSAAVLGDDGTLYIATLEGDLVAVQPGDGKLLWRYTTGGRIWSTPVLADGMLYSGNNAGKIVAVSAQDGTLAWEKDVQSPIYGGGALLDDAVVFPTVGGQLVAMALDGQQEAWRQSINGKLYTTPVVAGQNLVVSVLEGDTLLQAFTLDGQLSWPFSLTK